ncbi:MAG: trigger factor [Fimbriimonadales bacterium]
MKVETTELNPCTIELKVACTSDQVQSAYDKAYRKAAKRVRVPGFRPGAAPKHVAKQYLNLEEVKRIAAEDMIRAAYTQAVKDNDLKPAGQPRIEVTKLDEEASEFEFTAKVPLEPKIELGEYKGLAITAPEEAVTDEELEEQLDMIRNRRATRKTIDHRGAQDGDFAVVGIRAEGEDKDRRFMTVVGQTFPQLDQALSGMKAEDTKVVDLTFPETFQEKDWAGKPMKVDVTLRSLSAAEVPDLDEDFAKELNADNVDDLKERVRVQLAEAKKRMVRDYINEQLLEEVMKVSTIEVADTLWEGVADRRLQEIADDAQKENKTLKDIAESNNMSLEELAVKIGERAKAEVKHAVAIRKIFEAEEMKLEQADIRDQIVEIAQENNITPEEALRALKQSNSLAEIEFRAIYNRVLEFLHQNANVSKAGVA